MPCGTTVVLCWQAGCAAFGRVIAAAHLAVGIAAAVAAQLLRLQQQKKHQVGAHMTQASLCEQEGVGRVHFGTDAY